MYGAVRGLEAEAGHALWRSRRDELFATHPQSPIPAASRGSFSGLPVFEYDPALRFEAEVEETEPALVRIAHSGAGVTAAHAFGTVELDAPGMTGSLTLFWLDDYGGGVFLPFRDQTGGAETYGGGRYLLDGAKGADLGSSRRSLVLDFNFAYHPSCVHDPRWSCPLAPPQNHLSFPILGGERL